MSMTSARDPGGGLLLALAVILLNDRHRIEYLMYEVYVSFVERVATLPLTVASQSLSPTSIAHNAHRPIGSEYHFRADLVGMMLKINQGKLEADDVQIYSDVRIPKGKTLLVHGILPGSESKSEGKSEVSGEIAILIRPEIVRPTAMRLSAVATSWGTIRPWRMWWIRTANPPEGITATMFSGHVT